MFIKAKVIPGAKKEAVLKKAEDEFEIRVKAKPIEGKANKAAVRLLAGSLGVSKGKIRLIRGVKTRNKVFKL